MISQVSISSEQKKIPPRRFFIIILVTLVLGIVAFVTFNFLTKRELIVTVQGGQERISYTVYDTVTDERVFQKTSTDNKTVSVRLPRGSYRVEVGDETSQTLGYAELTSARKRTLNLNLANEKLAEKIGKNSLGCDIVENNILYSFGCTQPSVILEHTISKQDLISPEEITDFKQIGVAKSYKDGVLSIFARGDDVIPKYFNLNTKEFTDIKLPSEIGPDILSFVTDPFNPDNSTFFIINNKTYEAYVYKGPDDKSPRKFNITLKKGFRANSNISYFFNGISLFIYDGSPDISGDTEEESNNLAALRENFFYKVDVENLSQSSYEISRKIRSNEIFVINNMVGFLGKFDIKIHKISDNNIEENPNYIIRAPGSWAINNSGIYFVANNSLFWYKPQENQTQRVFSAQKINVSRVFSHNNQISFNGLFNADQQQVLHSFVLTQKPLTEKRLESIIPYSNQDIPINDMDYSSGSIIFRVRLESFVSDRQTGTLTFEEQEFEEKRAIIIDRLRKDGLDVNKFSVQFIY